MCRHLLHIDSYQLQRNTHLNLQIKTFSVVAEECNITLLYFKGFKINHRIFLQKLFWNVKAVMKQESNIRELCKCVMCRSI